MSRAILCLVFVAILASIGHGRVIEKRSPGADPGVGADIGGHIDNAIDVVGDFGSDAIDGLNDAGSTIRDFFGGLGRKKRSPGADPSFGSDVGGHIDNAIDVIGDFGSDIGDAFDDAGSAISDFFG